MNYLSLLTEAAAAMQQLEHVAVHEFRATAPTRPVQWSRVDKASRQELPTGVPVDLLAIYKQIWALSVRWFSCQPQLGPELVAGYAWFTPFDGLGIQGTPFYYPDNPRKTEPFWDPALPAAQQEELSTYRVWDRLEHNTYTLWREVDKRTELAFYLGFDRLHRLPFTPAQYVETGVALRFIELWQLLFIAEDEQADYAEAIGTVAAQVQALFPEALHLLPAHVAQYPAPAPAAGPDYQKLFAEAIAYLQAVPGVELATQWGQYRPGVHDQPPPSFGTTLGTFERLRRETGQPVPDELRAFYGQLDGCILRWGWADAAERPAGEEQQEGSIDLWPLARVFGGRQSTRVRHWDHRVHDGVLWAVGHADRVPGLAHLRPFEYINAEEYPCLRLPDAPDAPTDVCWLSGDLDDIYPLQLSFTTYLLRAFACLGVAEWQLLYRTDDLTYEIPGFARRIEEDLHRLGLDPDQVLPDRRVLS